MSEDAGFKSLIRGGRHGEALVLLESHVATHPDDAMAWLLKAISHRELGQFAPARAAALRAIKLPDANAAAYSLLGDILEEQGSLSEALQAYDGALARASQLYAALNGKGVVLQRLEQLAEARRVLESAVAVEPARVEARHNLAALLARTAEPELAIQHWREVLKLQPGHRGACVGLAKVLIKSALLPQALEVLRAAHAMHSSDQEIAFLCANVMELTGFSDEAEENYRFVTQGLAASDYHVRTFGEFLLKRGRLSEAREVLLSLASKGDIKARLMSDLALPSVYQDRRQLEECREGFERNLSRLAEELPASASSAIPAASPDDFLWSNFLLAYQGKDDLSCQRTYAAMLIHVLRNERPQFYQALKGVQASSGRLKVGFVSSFFFDHTVAWYFQSWVTGLARDGFDVRVYHLGASVDWMTRKIQARADTFRLATATSMDTLAETVRDDANDILIFPEIGMCPRTFVLASMRLAPVQIMGWGHPVTSGHANVDYILSPETMEPHAGDAHYSETLHRLPGIGTAYQMPDLPPPRSRRELGTEDELLVIVPQSLFKVHPDNDELVTRVLNTVPCARILFFADHSPENTESFRQRLLANIRKAELPVDRVSWLPRTDRPGFLATLQSCDVMMDTLHWSGGNTSIDALACGLPIVTLPGQFMRSRQTHGMLGEIGLQDVLSAADTDAYASKIVELADRQLRENLRRQIIAGHSSLFGQRAPIEALQSFLKQVVVSHA